MVRHRQSKNRKNEVAKVSARQQQIANLYLEGYSQTDIAIALKVTQPTISLALKKIRITWREQVVADYQEKYDEEINRIRKLERTAWEGFYRSCLPAETRHTRSESVPAEATPVPAADEAKPTKSSKKKKMHASRKKRLESLVTRLVEETTLKGQCGDRGWLEQVAWCIEMRLRLMGALDGNTVNNTLNVVNIRWDEMYDMQPLAVVDPIEAKIAAAEQQVTPGSAAYPTIGYVPGPGRHNGNGNGHHNGNGNGEAVEDAGNAIDDEVFDEDAPPEE